MAATSVLVVRAATAEDEPFLWRMLFEAAHMADDGATSVREAQAHPELARYLQGWMRPGDVGVIAQDRLGTPLGAAWVRFWSEHERGYGYVQDDVPELAIAVAPEHRGRGVGREMLTHLIHLLQAEGYPGISLSVRADSPALRLYERMGFVRVPRTDVTNRTGSRSFKMMRVL